ncbi:P-loop containing nucleoside triphosphate hydrolase protein [Coniochaeta sp. 2T2.1]|nr:P-loop containing nucleoside triphosphate hydrolase protein [Coniochaeta sp. 2T2.1]
MSANTENSGRAGHLHRLFRDVLVAKRQVKTPGEAQLFLEAVFIQQPAAVCVEKIISKTAALDAIRTSVRVDLTPTFIQQYVLKLVAFLSDPSVKSLANGQFLQDLLLAIVEPPTVWNAMVRLFLDHKLAEDSLPSFAWLVCELVSMPPTADLDLLEDIKSIVRDGAIMQAQDHGVRELGYRIKRSLEAKSATGSSPAAYAPGGRHDNDFEDFRKISIYPTTDEFLSTELPFYRKMNEVFDVDEAGRAAVHLDNQSRLLREDMLAELRNDLHVAMGKKQNRGRRAITLGQLQPEIERRAKRDLQLEKDRLARQAAYKKDLQDLDDDIDLQRRVLKYETEKEEQKKTLEQRRAEAASLRDTVERTKKQEAQRKKSERGQPPTSPKSQPAGHSPPVDGPAAPGTARYEWEQLKRLEGARTNPILDDLMAMIGLEDVKKQFLSVKSKVDTILRQNSSLKSERFSCKTTVARLYGRFLNSVGVIPGSRFEETTGSRLANMGVTGCKKLLDEIQNDGGGVLFIDEAYQLSSASTTGGGAVLDFLLAEVENLVGKVVFILAGYQKQTESFFAHNPGFPSRFPREFKFADYKDNELMQILKVKMGAKYQGRMKCEDGLDGLYTYVVARRIGYGRESEGFGNARTVENALAMISDRQADRLRRERSQGDTPDDFLYTKEDLIGPEPSGALANCEAWTKLQQLTGLGFVKTAVNSLVDTLTENYRRELVKEPIVQYSLNRVFLGNPGTGKTTVAKLLGLILCHLGLLSKSKVVVKNPSDFVGAHIGHSEQQTKGILASTIGKVLVIDEAYSLYPGGSGSTADPYKTAVIDTIVAEVQSVPGSDQCVLLLGYKSQMEDMFQNVNPGLARRFPIASAFLFEDFSDDELQQILNLKLKQQGFRATGQAKTVVKEMLSRARNRPNFGNAGEIDILLDAAKARHQTRLSNGETKCWKTLDAVDFDPDFNRAERTATNIRILFEGTVGAEDVIAKLEGYQGTARNMKSLGLNPKESVPFTFLFRGPPGTGKTTTAKKIAKVFYDMGFLATTEVIECSASDLVGQFVGQTGPQVRKVLDKALGKVLFIDEAYRLCDGPFAKEAIDELVDAVTKETYFKKFIVILAGYEKDINRLMSINSGLTSRFPEVINFRALTPAECFHLLVKVLQGQQKCLAERGNKLDLTALEAPADDFKNGVVDWFNRLGKQDGWGSARDVQTVAQEVFTKTIKGAKKGVALVVRKGTVEEALKVMFDERKTRCQDAGSRADKMLDHLRPQLPRPIASLPQTSQPQPSPATSTSTTTSKSSTTTAPSVPPSPLNEDDTPTHSHQTHPSAPQPKRDAGVSDEVWAQLQLDAAAEAPREEAYRSMLQARDDAAEAARELIVRGLIAKDEEERRRQEEERKRQEALREQIVRRLMEEEERRKEEAVARKKLAARGLCPAGFSWVKQSRGWRCAGGAHFVGDGHLEGM